MTDNHAALLTVDDVAKSYGARKALDRVSLTISEGEFVALLGPNGAGKSTLFQLLSGLFVADGGAISICGHDIRRAPVKALARIGIVFQQATLDLDLSVERNLMFHARLHGLGGADARRRVAAELDAQGLAERRRDRVRDLSGGNRRKVELARAMVHEPRVLLMDEATVGLDPGSRATLLDQVHGLCAARGVGVLWASHLVDEAERADRVVLLHQGRVRAEGTPAELVAGAGVDNLGQAFAQLTEGGGRRPPENSNPNR
ncbi:MAG: ATP-binding cassette domain-containing protein [Rhodocyclaceae bacterium]|nr:ATP-binding cassette domain-containing protein [Rhodocyclaceae bacterium]